MGLYLPGFPATHGTSGFKDNLHAPREARTHELPIGIGTMILNEGISGLTHPDDGQGRSKVYLGL